MLSATKYATLASRNISLASCICSPTSNNPVLGILYAWAAGCTGIGQRKSLSQHLALGVLQIVWLPKFTQQSLVQDGAAEIQHCDWLVGLYTRQASRRVQEILLNGIKTPHRY